MLTAVIKVPAAPLYKVPDAQSALADEVLHGMTVEILEKPTDGFYRVKTQYSYEGFINENNLNFDSALIDVWENSALCTVNNYCADVLSDSKIQGIRVNCLLRGCSVIKTGINENGFTKILTAAGAEGYIRTKFLGGPIPSFGSVSESQFRDSVIKTAMEYIGVQYRWGGKTPLGIDCSGLASISYYLNGVSIYRDAAVKEGFPVREVAFENIKPADLIFFPGHVAIYLGGGRYIHSSVSNDGVYINSFNPGDDNYRKDLAETITACGTIF